MLTAPLLIAGLLAACAAALATLPTSGPRLAALRPPPPDGARTPARLVALAAAVLLGAGAAALGGLLVGALVAAPAWAACRWLLGRPLATAGPDPGDVPPVLDLLAACLAAGCPIDVALAAAAPAVGGPTGDLLARVAAARALGAALPEAYDGARAGHPRTPAALDAAVRLLAQAESSGLSVTAGLSRLAEQERLAARARATAEARTVGVLAVVPLGLCFLPAFVLLGVVPVVVGAAGGLLR